MNIFFCINNNYLPQLLIAMTSILENNRLDSISFYIFSSDITPESEEKVFRLKSAYDNFTVTFLNPPDSIFKDLKLNIDHISIETYFRYIIADMLPYCDKGLYLDADIIVNESLGSLYSLDVETVYVAGVKDIYIDIIGYKEKIGFLKDDLYINAGVLLMNLRKIREDDKVTALFNNTRKYSDVIQYQDQDVINITFKNNIKEIGSIYNFITEYVRREKINRNKAVVIHYTGKIKPWHQNCKNKMRFLYKYYSYINNCFIENKKQHIVVKFLIMLWHSIFIVMKR